MGKGPDMESCRFYRQERLKHKKIIQQLFREAHSKKFFPLLLLYMRYSPEDYPYHQVLFSVPKKHFKQSVVRNKVRRRIREAYRRHKKMLYNKTSGLPFLLGYVYLSKNVQSYKSIETEVINSLDHLIRQSPVEEKKNKE